MQSESQLAERYGRDGASTILHRGLASRLYFSGMDIDTASNLAKTIGDVHFERFDALGNMRIEREALMTPPALRAMPDNQVLYLYANKRPALLTVTPYFERRDFIGDGGRQHTVAGGARGVSYPGALPGSVEPPLTPA